LHIPRKVSSFVDGSLHKTETPTSSLILETSLDWMKNKGKGNWLIDYEEKRHKEGKAKAKAKVKIKIKIKV